MCRPGAVVALGAVVARGTGRGGGVVRGGGSGRVKVVGGSPPQGLGFQGPGGPEILVY